MTQELQVIDQAPRAMVATPAELLQIAVQQGADLDKLERLMALQERWEANEAKKAYLAAFAAFRDEGVRLLKNRAVTDGPLRGKSYAELFAVVNATTAALSKHGLSASWSIVEDAKDWIRVRCTLTHTAGHAEFVEMGGPPDVGGAKNAIQARASTVSYLERYTLKAILGLAEQDDDSDANAKDAGPGDELVDAGRAAALEGMESLTAWWGSLTARQRSQLNKEFPAMRRAAKAVDEGQA